MQENRCKLSKEVKYDYNMKRSWIVLSVIQNLFLNITTAQLGPKSIMKTRIFYLF